MNRQEAIAAWAKTYTPHRPCARGHMAPRYTRSGACLQCLADDKDARQRTAAGLGPVNLTLRCHPDDAAVLVAMHEHLTKMRAATTPTE